MIMKGKKSMGNYYNQDFNDLRKEINGTTEGLSSEQAKKNQEKYGYNELSEGKKKTVLQIFLEQYKDFLVIILIWKMRKRLSLSKHFTLKIR